MKEMTISEIAAYFDHTLLKPEAGQEQYKTLCGEAREWKFACVCVPSSWVSFCSELLEGSTVGVCSVVGFPHGNCSTQAKCAEARYAIQAGAKEIDLVMPFGRFMAGDREYLRRELEQIVSLREGCLTMGGSKAVIKIILENAALRSAGHDEGSRLIQEACLICSEVGVDFVKTGTGFFPNGSASLEDVELMLECVDGERVRVKAAGGIKTMSDARKFIAAGASRLGCSASVPILRGLQNSGSY